MELYYEIDKYYNKKEKIKAIEKWLKYTKMKEELNEVMKKATFFRIHKCIVKWYNKLQYNTFLNQSVVDISIIIYIIRFKT